MSLTTGSAGLALIKKYEGCKLTAYKDSAGVWTIGYGHTSGVKSGMTITQAQADSYLKSDVKTAENAVNKYYSKYNWNQNQFDALVSFAYNIGNITQLTASGTRSNTIISQKILLYNKAGGKVLAGLTNRRKAEQELFLKAVSTSTTNTASSSNSSAPTFKTGSTYTTQAEMVVRKEPKKLGKPVGYNGLTANAKKHDSDKDGALDKGTKVTCKGTEKDSNGNIWMKIPSGYIAAYFNGKVYCK